MRSRLFTLDDQIAFAQLSGDNNPLHIDAVAARRMLFGQPVVHGIHALLWGLDCWCKDQGGTLALRSLKAVFSRPLRISDTASVTLEPGKDGQLGIRLRSGGTIAIAIDLEWTTSLPQPCDSVRPGDPECIVPRVLSADDIASDSGILDLYLNMEAARRLFPNVIRCLPALQVAVLLSTTRLVGVYCPGRHSIYSELALMSGVPDDSSAMRYDVGKFDKRIGLASIALTAPGMTGTIKAFQRPAPQEQAAYLTMKRQIVSHEFAGQRALIIGGSRGLGEVAAKLLAAGGAETRITYHRGKEDADRIVDDIRSHGGTADGVQFDVVNPQLAGLNLATPNRVPTHLYYFATPFIFAGAKGTFSPRLFTRFCDYYVTGFVDIVSQLYELGTRRIFYPSTVAIDELPTDMGEYAAAKVAAETLCTFLEKTRRDLGIYRPRLPRVATDQTASVMPITNQDPVPLMLERLRSFRDWSIGSRG